jgi:hypothetical protein
MYATSFQLSAADSRCGLVIAGIQVRSRYRHASLFQSLNHLVLAEIIRNKFGAAPVISDRHPPATVAANCHSLQQRGAPRGGTFS